MQYIPQRPSLLPGSPLDFLTKIRAFGARQHGKTNSNTQYGSTSSSDENDIDPIELAAKWGIEKTLWQRDWGTLSGGEAQRIALAVAVGIGGAEILLLDGMYITSGRRHRWQKADSAEPTSALDEQSSLQVEQTLLSLLPPEKGKPSEVSSLTRDGAG